MLQRIAHRGFSALAPENTIAAFLKAVEYGAFGIEFDVQLSSDRVPIVFHDSTLERTTNGSGKLQDQTLAQLQTLDAGSWFSQQFTGEKIPTLSQVLAQLEQTNIFLYIEIKNADFWQQEEIKQLTAMLLNPPWQKRVCIASFNDSFLAKVAEVTKEIPLGYYPLTITDYHQKLGAVLMVNYSLLLENPDLVPETQTRGLDLVAWTVDRQEDLEQLINLGVTKIITNTLLVFPNQSQV